MPVYLLEPIAQLLRSALNRLAVRLVVLSSVPTARSPAFHALPTQGLIQFGDRSRSNSSPICWRGILSSLLMRSSRWTLVSITWSCPGNGRQLHRSLRPVQHRRGGPKKSRSPRTPAGQQVPGPQLGTGSMGYQGIDQPPAHPLDPRGRGRPFDDPDPESLWVQANSHRHRELECLKVDLRANVCNLADRDASEFDRRAGGEPSDGFFEDELVGLGTAGGGLEGLGPVAVQNEDCVRCGCRQDPIGRGRLERDATDQDGQERLCLTPRPLAESDTSIPLACQKRVLAVTY